MNKIQGTTTALGIAALMVIALACGNGAEPTVTGSIAADLRPTVTGSIAADLRPTVTGSIAADLRLTFEGVEYTAAEILGAATPNGSRVSGGTPIDMDDMEVVGTGAWHQSAGDRTMQIYRPKVGGTTDVYTFHTTQTVSRVEADTTPATWTRWISK